MLLGHFLLLGLQSGLALCHPEGSLNDLGFLLLLQKTDSAQALNFSLLTGFNLLLLQPQQILILGISSTHHHPLLFNVSLSNVLITLNRSLFRNLAVLLHLDLCCRSLTGLGLLHRPGLPG